MAKGIGLKPAEIDAAFDSEELRRRFPIIMTVPHVAELFCVTLKTIYAWRADGRFDGCFRKRGKHLRFWRNRLIDRFYNGPEWEPKK